MDNRTAILQMYLGKPAHVVVDRPIGYNHHGIIYPVNYGYIPGLVAADAEEQDAYILGISVPVAEFDGIVIGAAIRKNDVEDKLIVAPEGMHFSREQLEVTLHFQEQFFDTVILLP